MRRSGKCLVPTIVESNANAEAAWMIPRSSLLQLRQQGVAESLSQWAPLVVARGGKRWHPAETGRAEPEMREFRSLECTLPSHGTDGKDAFSALSILQSRSERVEKRGSKQERKRESVYIIQEARNQRQTCNFDAASVESYQRGVVCLLGVEIVSVQACLTSLHPSQTA